MPLIGDAQSDHDDVPMREPNTLALALGSEVLVDVGPSYA